MDFYAVLDQVLALLRQRGRVSYRALKVQFHLDDEQLEALKEELLYTHQGDIENDGRGLTWTGGATVLPTSTRKPGAPAQVAEPLDERPAQSGSPRAAQRASRDLVLSEALALVEKQAERYYEAELYRLKGELLLMQAAS